MLWLPKERVLFAGDILVEDGITMVVDGYSSVMLSTLDLIDSLKPAVIVPGHGVVPSDPAQLVAQTRTYLTGLRSEMKAAIEKGTPMRAALASLPPADEGRAVSPNTRRRRNAVRVYLEMERASMGLDEVPEGDR
jgi:cyclase